MKFFLMLKLLFPKSRILNFINDTLLRKFAKGLSSLPEDVRHESDLVYMNLYPSTTMDIDAWEKQFGVVSEGQSDADRRKILVALWRSTTGGQSASYLQNILSAIDPNIKVVENVPVTNPRDSFMRIFAVCSNEAMCCGNEKGCCSYRRGDDLFVPRILRNDTEELYSIPNDPLWWEPCFFVCREVEYNNNNNIMLVRKLEIDAKWQNYLEYLILKFKPVQTKAVMFVEYI